MEDLMRDGTPTNTEGLKMNHASPLQSEPHQIQVDTLESSLQQPVSGEDTQYRNLRS